jgi:hypothetical protein
MFLEGAQPFPSLVWTRHHPETEALEYVQRAKSDILTLIPLLHNRNQFTFYQFHSVVRGSREIFEYQTFRGRYGASTGPVRLSTYPPDQETQPVDVQISRFKVRERRVLNLQ